MIRRANGVSSNVDAARTSRIGDAGQAGVRVAHANMAEWWLCRA